MSSDRSGRAAVDQAEKAFDMGKAFDVGELSAPFPDLLICRVLFEDRLVRGPEVTEALFFFFGVFIRIGIEHQIRATIFAVVLHYWDPPAL